jgi:hypothetical protein
MSLHASLPDTQGANKIQLTRGCCLSYDALGILLLPPSLLILKTRKGKQNGKFRTLTHILLCLSLTILQLKAQPAQSCYPRNSMTILTFYLPKTPVASIAITPPMLYASLIVRSIPTMFGKDSTGRPITDFEEESTK